MNPPLRLLCALALFVSASLLRGATDAIAAVRAADDARVAAMISTDPAKLKEAFSDDLRYVHSNGRLDTKATFIEALTSGKSQYAAMTYESRNFREVVPGLVLMDAKVRMKLGTKEPFIEAYFSVLAAYRLEQGAWRFVAWQSCRLEDPAAKK